MIINRITRMDIDRQVNLYNGENKYHYKLSKIGNKHQTTSTVKFGVVAYYTTKKNEGNTKQGKKNTWLYR